MTFDDDFDFDTDYSGVELTYHLIGQGEIDPMDIYSNPHGPDERKVSGYLASRGEDLARSEGLDEQNDLDQLMDMIVEELGQEYP